MTKAELIAELRSIVTGGSQFSADHEVASSAHGAAHAIDVRLASAPGDLPDYDALAKPKYEVPGQGGPDRPHDDDPE